MAPCVLFGKRAEARGGTLRKGEPVTISERIVTRSWEAPDGSKRSATEVHVDEVEMLGKRDGADARSSNGGDRKRQSLHETEEQGDIPF